MWELLVLAAIVGLFAELVDGTLGMAYGVTSTSLLLTLGATPAIASASVHTAEVVTTLVSGVSHLKVGNVNKSLFKKLVIPGSITAVIGAYLLVNMPLWFIKPAVSIYLTIIGLTILLRVKGINLITKKLEPPALAGIGGFVDAIGGGGWGPVVTTTLISNGEEPKAAIGSVNLAEFFITFFQTVTFLALLGLQNLNVILGLIIGGSIVAPFGAILCRKAPAKILMILVGALIIFLSVRNLVLYISG